ncbi:hypothetical protein ACI65C_010914 [Semiaphis heraclei]
MFTIYLCLVSVILAPIVSSKISLLSFGGKTYLNGQYVVKTPDNVNIKDEIVNGNAQGKELVIVKELTLKERLTLVKRLKASNDILTQLEEEKVKRLEDHEDELEKLLKREEKERLKNLRNENKVPQKTLRRKKFIVKKMPEQNKITEVDGVEGESRMMQYD